MRANLRRLTDDGRVEMGDQAAPLRNALDRVPEKNVRRGALPALIRRREVGANVSIGDGSKDSVGQRMKKNIGV